MAFKEQVDEAIVNILNMFNLIAYNFVIPISYGFLSWFGIMYFFERGIIQQPIFFVIPFLNSVILTFFVTINIKSWWVNYERK